MVCKHFNLVEGTTYMNGGSDWDCYECGAHGAQQGYNKAGNGFEDCYEVVTPGEGWELCEDGYTCHLL